MIPLQSFCSNISTVLKPCTDVHHIIGGDYNGALNSSIDRIYTNDKRHPTQDEGSRELLQLASKLDLEDIWRKRNKSSKMYTFSRNNSKSRTDYYLTSVAIDIEIDSCLISHFPFSDRNAVTLTLNTKNIPRGPGTWKLNVSILDNLQYVVENFWFYWKLEKNNFPYIRTWWDAAYKTNKHRLL